MQQYRSSSLQDDSYQINKQYNQNKEFLFWIHLALAYASKQEQLDGRCSAYKLRQIRTDSLVITCTLEN